MENERKACEEKFLEGLTQWNSRIELLKIKAEKAGVNRKAEYYKILGALERKRDKAGKKFQDLRGAGDEAWEAVKKGADKTWAEIRIAYEDAASKFRSEEEPAEEEQNEPPRPSKTDPP